MPCIVFDARYCDVCTGAVIRAAVALFKQSWTLNCDADEPEPLWEAIVSLLKSVALRVYASTSVVFQPELLGRFLLSLSS